MLSYGVSFGYKPKRHLNYYFIYRASGSKTFIMPYLPFATIFQGKNPTDFVLCLFFAFLLHCCTQVQRRLRELQFSLQNSHLLGLQVYGVSFGCKPKRHLNYYFIYRASGSKTFIMPYLPFATIFQGKNPTDFVLCLFFAFLLHCCTQVQRRLRELRFPLQNSHLLGFQACGVSF